MVSGALLLPIRFSTSTFLKRRCLKVLFPTLVWSIFYLLCNIFVRGDNVELMRSLLSLPFSAQGNSVLWFMYSLMGLYLLAPILSRWLNGANRKELDFYLGIWVITLCYPIISFVADVNIGNTGVLYYFAGYVGYFVLGYYLKQYPDSFSPKFLIPALVIVIVAPVACKLLHLHVDFYEMFWYLSVFVVVQCVCWFRVVEKFSNSCFARSSIRKLIIELSNLSFGVYLVHIFIMRYVLWHCNFILSINSYVLQTLTVALLTFAASTIICYILSFIPKAQYLIGFKH